MSTITSITLHSFLTELCSKYSFSRSYFKNILKVMKGTFREATDVYGFIRYNPSLTLKLPKIEDSSDFENKVINVRHSVFEKKKNENGRWYIGTTKTKSGERQIHIS